MTEKLLPIVAGCSALVIAGAFSGKTVFVMRVFTADMAPCLVGGDKFIGEWICTLSDAPYGFNLLLPERILMRLDGGERLPDFININMRF